jgi:hypothetical protein
MTPEQIGGGPARLLAFVEQMFGGLARNDQRPAAEEYVRGLLTEWAA